MLTCSAPPRSSQWRGLGVGASSPQPPSWPRHCCRSTGCPSQRSRRRDPSGGRVNYVWPFRSPTRPRGLDREHVVMYVVAGDNSVLRPSGVMCYLPWHVFEEDACECSALEGKSGLSQDLGSLSTPTRHLSLRGVRSPLWLARLGPRIEFRRLRRRPPGPSPLPPRSAPPPPPTLFLHLLSRSPPLPPLPPLCTPPSSVSSLLLLSCSLSCLAFFPLPALPSTAPPLHVTRFFKHRRRVPADWQCQHWPTRTGAADHPRRPPHPPLAAPVNTAVVFSKQIRCQDVQLAAHQRAPPGSTAILCVCFFYEFLFFI